MRTERKKHHENEKPAIDTQEIEPFEAPTATKAEVKALEERARIKALKAIEIKKAKDRKKVEDDRLRLLAKAQLAKPKRKPAQPGSARPQA